MQFFFRKKQCPCIIIRTYYSWFDRNMAPFRWPTTANDLVIVTEVAARRPRFTMDWEAITKILSAVFSTEQKSIELTGRACRERMDRLLDCFCG